MTTTELSKDAGLSAAAQTLADDNLSPAQYVELLEKRELFQDAVQFHAHTLEPRGAIEWAGKCVQELDPPDQRPETAESAAAVEKWLTMPADPSRWAAKEAAEKSQVSFPADLLAMAVFLSGGSMTPAGSPETPPPRYASQKMAGGSVLVAVVSHSPESAKKRYRRALELAGYRPPTEG